MATRPKSIKKTSFADDGAPQQSSWHRSSDWRAGQRDNHFRSQSGLSVDQYQDYVREFREAGRVGSGVDRGLTEEQAKEVERRAERASTEAANAYREQYAGDFDKPQTGTAFNQMGRTLATHEFRAEELEPIRREAQERALDEYVAEVLPEHIPSNSGPDAEPDSAPDPEPEPKPDPTPKSPTGKYKPNPKIRKVPKPFQGVAIEYTTPDGYRGSVKETYSYEDGIAGISEGTVQELYDREAKEEAGREAYEEYADRINAIADDINAGHRYPAIFANLRPSGENRDTEELAQARQRVIAAAVRMQQNDDGDGIPSGRYRIGGDGEYERIGDVVPIQQWRGLGMPKSAGKEVADDMNPYAAGDLWQHRGRDTGHLHRSRPGRGCQVHALFQVRSLLGRRPRRAGTTVQVGADAQRGAGDWGDVLRRQ